MRCTWKITKLIPSIVSESNFSAEDLIFDFHNLLTSIPPSEWKKLSSESPMPQIDLAFKTIKTMLLEFVSCYKELIFDHMGRISDPSSSNAITMIKAMVDSDRKKQGLQAYEDTRLMKLIRTPRIKTAIVQSTGEHGNNSPLRRAMTAPDHSLHAKLLGNNELDKELSAIFQKISNKDITKEGIQDLYNFQKIHTYADAMVESHLSKTGQYFQGYIRRGLANLMAEEHATETRKVSDTPDTKQPAIIAMDPYEEKLSNLKRMFVNDSSASQKMPVAMKMGGLVGVIEDEIIQEVEPSIVILITF